MHVLRSLAAIGGLALGAASNGLAQNAGASAAPLTLSTLLVRAVSQHPLVEAARARLRGAEGSRLTARSLGNPIATYQVENAPFPGRDALQGIDREVSTFATIPLEPLFQRWPRVRAANADVRAAQAELDLARRAVSLDAARAFYRVALGQAAVDGATDVRDRLAELAEYTRARVKEGVTSEGDQIRVQVELDRAEAELALAQVDLARARGELAPYLGAITLADAGSTGTLADIRVAVDTTGAEFAGAGRSAAGAVAPLATYVARARESRPDLLAARARVAAAKAEAGYQRTLSVRQLGATVGSKRIGGVSTMIAGISVPIPLFDQNRGEVQRASAEQSAAEQELAWRERQVTAQVAAAHEAVRLVAGRRGRLSDSLIARAEESRRIALAAYREGATSLLQVLDASRTLADVRLAAYRTLIVERESLLELNIVAGTEPLGPAPALSTTSSLSSPDARAAGRDGARP